MQGQTPREKNEPARRRARELWGADNSLNSKQISNILEREGLKVSNPCAVYDWLRHWRGSPEIRTRPKEFLAAIDALKKDPLASYRDLHRLLNAQGIVITLSSTKYAFQHARRELGLLNKPTRAKSQGIKEMRSRQEKPKQMQPPLVTASAEQVVDSIIWMGSELKRLRAESKRFQDENEALRKQVDSQRTRIVELQTGGGEESLTGRRAH